MANAQNIECTKRDIKNKHFLKEQKRQGFIPGIVYGKGVDSQPIFLPGKQFTKTLQVHGLRGLFSIDMGGENPTMALIREIQKDPLSGKLIHVDFLTVRMDEKVNTLVSVHIHGEEDILKKGALIQVGLNEVEVICYPKDIPNNFSCDVSDLEIGENITVADLIIPEEVELVTDAETLIVAVLAPGKGAEEETEEEETGEIIEETADEAAKE